jgi:hypothetical protein
MIQSQPCHQMHIPWMMRIHMQDVRGKQCAGCLMCMNKPSDVQGPTVACESNHM